MSDRHEQRIDAALDVLREPQAPQGMESRVLAAVRKREVAAASATSTSLSSGRRGLVWVGVVAAVVVSVGMLAVARREAPAVGGSLANGVAHRGAVVNSGARATVDVKHDVEPAVTLVSAPVKRMRQTRSGAAAIQDVARSDADLPSFPAPPAPLTQEERLLLRVVRSGDRMELAMLDPAMRNERVEEEKAEVRKFFGEVTYKGDSE